MKIVLLGDLHLGARNGSGHFSKYFNQFFTDVLYPYIDKHKIKHVIQLGDLFDNRTNLVYKALHACKDVWFGGMRDRGIEYVTLIGNHDITYKNTLEINSPELLLGEYDNIKIITEPQEVNVAGYQFDIIPWICDSNKDAVAQFMTRKDKSDICLGHFEIAGFDMHRGSASTAGCSPSVFDGYAKVFSGHYHTSSTRGNITYTGIPYEITWSDYSDPKGFFVFDTVTKKHTFIPNHLTMFAKVVYNNGYTVNLQTLSGKIVRVIVQEKKDPVLFEKFLDSLRLVNPYHLDVVDGQNMSSSASLDDELDVEDTPGIIANYIETIDVPVDKDELLSYIMSLYNEALTLNDRI